MTLIDTDCAVGWTLQTLYQQLLKLTDDDNADDEIDDEPK